MSLKMKDTVKNRTYPKRPFAWYVEKPSSKDYLLTVFIFAVCTLIGLLFFTVSFIFKLILSFSFYCCFLELYHAAVLWSKFFLHCNELYAEALLKSSVFS